MTSLRGIVAFSRLLVVRGSEGGMLDVVSDSDDEVGVGDGVEDEEERVGSILRGLEAVMVFVDVCGVFGVIDGGPKEWNAGLEWGRPANRAKRRKRQASLARRSNGRLTTVFKRRPRGLFTPLSSQSLLRLLPPPSAARPRRSPRDARVLRARVWICARTNSVTLFFTGSMDHDRFIHRGHDENYRSRVWLMERVRSRH